MTTLSGLTHEQVLLELKAAGLGSLPGGGAEVFADRVRRLVAPGKESPEIWFHVHDTAHRLGIPTHCTILYGHVETYEERVDHMLRLREQQDRTGGFLAFIPLAFHPENTVFERRGWRHTTGTDDLKMLAVLAADARQRAEHQGLLDHDGHAARRRRAPLRRERRAGDGRAGGDLPRRGRPHRDRAEGGGARPLRARGGAGSRCSATRSTGRSGDGRDRVRVGRADHPRAGHRGVRRLVPGRARLRGRSTPSASTASSAAASRGSTSGARARSSRRTR